MDANKKPAKWLGCFNEPDWNALRFQVKLDLGAWKSAIGSFIYLWFWAWINSISQIYTQKRSPQIEPLPDAGFDVFHYLVGEPGQYAGLADQYMAVFMLMTFGRFIPTGRLIRVITRYWMLEGTAFALRGFMIFVTNLPNPYAECVPTPVTYPIPVMAMRVQFGLAHTCGDCIPSGHTFAITNAFFLWLDHTQNSWIKAAMLVVAFGGWCVIILTHFHYTIDVCVGILVTILVRGLSCITCGLPWLPHEHNGVPHKLTRCDGSTPDSVDAPLLELALQTQHRLSIGGGSIAESIPYSNASAGGFGTPRGSYAAHSDTHSHHGAGVGDTVAPLNPIDRIPSNSVQLGQFQDPQP